MQARNGGGKVEAEVRIRAHGVGSAAQLLRSRQRETRGVNEGKEGRDAQNVDLRFRGGRCPGPAGGEPSIVRR